MRAIVPGLLILVLGATALARNASAAESNVKIAVLDLKASGVEATLASSATGLVASEIAKVDVFRVISRDDIRSMLQFEKDKQLLGCEADQECLAELGGALGVDYTVAGALGKVGSTFVLSLSLTNTKTAQVENRVSENVARPDQIVNAASRTARSLISRLLSGRHGFLVVTSAESGASVKIDGQIRGSTPLAGRLSLSWGPHLLEVEKTGFITYSEDISIPNKQVLAKSVALVPSNDFIQAYDGRARKMRLGAWIASGVAVLGIGLAIGFNQWAASSESTFQSERARYLSGDASVTQAQLNALSTKGSNEVLVARMALVAGVLGAGIATWLWLAGDDPHRYDGYREAPVSSGPVAISLSAIPLSRGAALAMGGSF